MINVYPLNPIANTVNTYKIMIILFDVFNFSTKFLAEKKIYLDEQETVEIPTA